MSFSSLSAMKIVPAVAVALLFSVVTASQVGTPFTVGQDVETTSGIIHGHAGVNRDQVSEYLGIPFAKPPIDDLRFAAPEPYRSNAYFNASNFGTTCLEYRAPLNFSVLATEGYHLAPTAEQFLSIGNEDGLPLGEDCLTLNVWSKPETGERAKAVLFYIYGGGFQGGHTDGIFTRGDIIADEEDVVVVSANYRINVFGFPGLQPEVSGMAPNAGLLDQRLAIEWVRDNVAGFGGDPARITLFGQSAGSISVHMYSYAYAHDPIVNGLIAQSGTVESFGASPANSTLAWLYMAGLLGCSTRSSGSSSNTTTTTTMTAPSTANISAAELAKTVACVRSKPASQVLSASLQVPYQQSSLGVFSPTADNKTVFSNYSNLTAARRLAPVPRILGSNAQEGTYFQLQYALSRITLPPIFWAFFTLVIFTCPTASAASAFSSQNIKIWRYTYNGDYPNTQLTMPPTESLGAYHGAELRPLFGLAPALGIPSTPAELATGRLLRSAWSSFAKDPHRALSSPPFTWPAYSVATSPAEAQVVELGLGNATYATFRKAEEEDELCSALMPGFEAWGGANGLVRYVTDPAAVQMLEQELQGVGNVTQVLDVLLRAAGLERR
ncbi:MAG: hypothetical protein Q9227_006744 [Pyrenula ochraceoflavens]